MSAREDPENRPASEYISSTKTTCNGCVSILVMMWVRGFFEYVLKLTNPNGPPGRSAGASPRIWARTFALSMTTDAVSTECLWYPDVWPGGTMTCSSVTYSFVNMGI